MSGDYSLGEILDRPGSIAGTLSTSNGIAAGLTQTQASSILNSFSFLANGTKAFTAIGFSEALVAFNDSVAGFNSSTDSIIHLISYNISATNAIQIASFTH